MTGALLAAALVLIPIGLVAFVEHVAYVRLFRSNLPRHSKGRGPA